MESLPIVNNKNTNSSELIKLSLKQPLNLSELVRTRESLPVDADVPLKCLLCELDFPQADIKPYLAHLLKVHQLVISDVDQIGSFLKYNSYWREKLASGVKIEDVCFKINTNTGANDKAQSETFFLLSDDLPEDNELRKRLNIFKLEKALRQLEIERNDKNYYRKCFFCNEMIGNTKANFISHWSKEHNFSIGNPDNIVYFDEFYQTLNSRFENLQCLFCNKVFYDKFIHKEHMRKKKHKCIDPNNKEFDRFYIINYLEYHKFWQEIKQERDVDEPNKNISNEQLDDWTDPVQTFYCLFCDESFDNETEIVSHMTCAHAFDFRAKICQNNELSFYGQVKLINYIRRQMYLGVCHVCSERFGEAKDELRRHLSESGHVRELPGQDLWDQPEYYFSTFEDDSLLCLLDDDAYSKDELKIKVIPEDVNIKIDEDLIKSIQELKLSSF